MDREPGPEARLAGLQAALAQLGIHSDLGASVNLQGGPEDDVLLRAAAAGDFGAVRDVLVGTPYELDPRLAEVIVEDLRIGRAGISG
jgi:hypothetical protein